VYLFRGVDEQEEEGEGARGDRAPLERKCFDLREEGVEGRSAGIAVAPRAACLTQRLDRFERRLALEPADHAAKRGGEPPHVVVQWDVLTSHCWAGNHVGAGKGVQAKLL
jgi:hypothetical protein